MFKRERDIPVMRRLDKKKTRNARKFAMKALLLRGENKAITLIEIKTKRIKTERCMSNVMIILGLLIVEEAY